MLAMHHVVMQQSGLLHRQELAAELEEAREQESVGLYAAIAAAQHAWELRQGGASMAVLRKRGDESVPGIHRLL
jgi:hypothetical protein